MPRLALPSASRPTFQWISDVLDGVFFMMTLRYRGPSFRNDAVGACALQGQVDSLPILCLASSLLKDQFMLTDTPSEQTYNGILSPHEGSPVSESVDHAVAMGGLAQFLAGWAE